ncbi:uncharacterized protein [Montipora foliosa]|uniref:uncharacterized protein isoform X2 n=1 Tax=Montipora foliosa TaxID=591990 RepID=UPI0035F17B25
MVTFLVLLVLFKEASGGETFLNAVRKTTVAFAAKRSLPNRQLLVGYWGQNSIAHRVSRSNWEKDLRFFCNNHKFDIYMVAFIHRLFKNNRNKDGLPGMNFAHHCSYAPDPGTSPDVFECATIGGGIRDCQKLGKKMLISLGGDTCDGSLGSTENAKKLAYYIWNMFLGGKEMQDRRPFLWAVMDGVDLNIEIGSHKYYPDFVREMRRLMNTDPGKQYFITAAPQCPFPDKWMGPEIQGSALEEYGHEFDFLFIQFYNNYCYPGGQYFLSVMDTWLNWARSIPNGPLIVLGLPAGPKAAGKPHYYFPPDKLASVYKQIRDKPGVGGMMFWDCSWVQNNIINGEDYGAHAFKQLRNITNPPSVTTKSPSTHAPPPTTQRPSAPWTKTLQIATRPMSTSATATSLPVTTSPGSCSKASGYFPDPSDCAKFIICAGKKTFYQNCPPGLLFNKNKRFCDWPHNVKC